jgi:hypothetical protein
MAVVVYNDGQIGFRVADADALDGNATVDNVFYQCEGFLLFFGIKIIGFLGSGILLPQIKAFQSLKKIRIYTEFCR